MHIIRLNLAGIIDNVSINKIALLNIPTGVVPRTIDITIAFIRNIKFHNTAKIEKGIAFLINCKHSFLLNLKENFLNV
jgi:hypothetical protein